MVSFHLKDGAAELCEDDFVGGGHRARTLTAMIDLGPVPVFHLNRLMICRSMSQQVTVTVTPALFHFRTLLAWNEMREQSTELPLRGPKLTDSQKL